MWLLKCWQYIASKLRPHQKDGVKFMYECVMGMRSKSFLGCLLADEMGTDSKFIPQLSIFHLHLSSTSMMVLSWSILAEIRWNSTLRSAELLQFKKILLSSHPFCHVTLLGHLILKFQYCRPWKDPASDHLDMDTCKTGTCWIQFWQFLCM